jgi:hypothetical protein
MGVGVVCGSVEGLDIGVAVEACAGVAGGGGVTVGVSETALAYTSCSAALEAVTCTVIRSLAGVAFDALIVIVLVQVPAAIARNVICLSPPVFGPSVPIGFVKPLGIKHPPLTTSVRTTFAAGAEPILAYPI